MRDFPKFSEEFIAEFIELYRKETLLWNIRHRDHNNRRKRRLSYSKLAEKLKEVYPEADEELVIRKIGNLRSAHLRESKKVEFSKKTAKTVEDIYEPKLWYYKLFSFLNEENTDIRVTSTDIFECIEEEHLIHDENDKSLIFKISTEDFENNVSKKRKLSIDKSDFNTNRRFNTSSNKINIKPVVESDSSTNKYVSPSNKIKKTDIETDFKTNCNFIFTLNKKNNDTDVPSDSNSDISFSPSNKIKNYTDANINKNSSISSKKINKSDSNTSSKIINKSDSGTSSNRINNHTVVKSGYNPDRSFNILPKRILINSQNDGTKQKIIPLQNQINYKKSPNTLFGEYIAAELDKIKDEKIVQRIKFMIQEIIYKHYNNS